MTYLPIFYTALLTLTKANYKECFDLCCFRKHTDTSCFDSTPQETQKRLEDRDHVPYKIITATKDSVTITSITKDLTSLGCTGYAKRHSEDSAKSPVNKLFATCMKNISKNDNK